MKIENLGINLGFANNRFPEPEAWTKIVHDIGLNKVQFVADILNPMIKKYNSVYFDCLISDVVKYTKIYDIRITSIMTSSFTRVNHFAHPDIEYKYVWFQWFKDFLEMGAEFEATSAGSHFGILTTNSLEESRKNILYQEALGWWKLLSVYAKSLEYKYLFIEPMSIEREFGNTIEATQKLLEDLNNECVIPIKLCLDVGHAPHPSQRDYKEWLKAFAKDSIIIHLQQTTKNNSNHSPFTNEYNENGIIKPDDIINILDDCYGDSEDYPELDFEISFREKEEIEPTIIPSLKESVKYWKNKIIEYNEKNIN